MSIFDIFDHFKHAGEKIDYVIQQDRPDPYVSPLEWSPDSTRLLVSYQIRDTAFKTQNGVFVYDISNGTFSDLYQFAPSEYDHIDIKKPEGFHWR